VLGTWCVGLVIVGAVLSLPTFLIGGALLGPASAASGPPTGSSCSASRRRTGRRVLRPVRDRRQVQRRDRPDPVRGGRLDAAQRGLGTRAYQVGIFSFLILLLVGVWLLRGVPEPAADHWDVAEAEAVLAGRRRSSARPGATAIGRGSRRPSHWSVREARSRRRVEVAAAPLPGRTDHLLERRSLGRPAELLGAIDGGDERRRIAGAARPIVVWIARPTTAAAAARPRGR
jgi:hypothetical protein